jgi:hypothetical protein
MGEAGLLVVDEELTRPDLEYQVGKNEQRANTLSKLNAQWEGECPLTLRNDS